MDTIMAANHMFYDSLRALGPIEAQTVPDAIANQIMANGTFRGDMTQCKATLALYSHIASTSTVAEFNSVLETGILPSGDKLNFSEKSMALAGKPKCTWSSCEEKCTPAGGRGGRDSGR